MLTTPLFHAFAAVQADVGLTIEDLGRAMVAATETHGENPLYALERGEMTEPEFLGLLGAAMSNGTGREIELHDFAEKYFAQLKPNGVLVAPVGRGAVQELIRYAGDGEGGFVREKLCDVRFVPLLDGVAKEL